MYGVYIIFYYVYLIYSKKFIFAYTTVLVIPFSGIRVSAWYLMHILDVCVKYYI